MPTLHALVWLSLISVLPNACGGDEPARNSPLAYRRYFVPADRPKEWPKGNVSYLPVDREEFERLVEAANSVPLGKPAAGAAQITAAVYEAALDSRDRLAGEARFKISSSRTTPVLLPLSPLGLVVDDAVWHGASNAKAVAGIDASGQFSVLVEGPGTLVSRWSLAGRREPDGSLRFPLELPRAAVARMQLDLPPGRTPSVSAGVLAGDHPAAEQHRWEFELGGRTETSLTIVPDEAQGRHRRLTLLQEHVDYRFTPGGLEVDAQIRLDVHHEPLRRLELELDRGLRLVAAQQGGAHLNWSDSAGQVAGASRAVLDFAEPLLGPGRTILITAIAPLVLDESWTLPRIRVQGVVWQEGSASLVVPAPLALAQLLPLRCRQLKSGPAASARSSDTFDLQFFSADASARVLFRWRKPRATLSTATTVSLSSESCQAEAQAWFELAEGENFVLSADVAEGWLVDSVVSAPPGAVSTWTVEDSGAARSLVVQLAEPLSPTRPLKLRIGGRRAATLDDPLTEASLRMVKFRDVVLSDQLLALAPEGLYQLRLDGVEQPRLLRPGELTASQRKLIADLPSDAWIDLATAQPGWTATLKPRAPRYTAEIVVDALSADSRVIEDYLIRCKPDGSKLDRVLVRFSQSRSTPLRWESASPLGPIAAQRISPQAAPALVAGHVAPEHETGADANRGETWELRWARPCEEPFELRARRESACEGDLAISLAALDGATSQQAVMRVRSDGPVPEIHTAERLAPLPLESIAAESGPLPEAGRPVAVYRYDPLVELGHPPTAAVLHRAAHDPPGAMIWRLRLRSQLSSSGRTLHSAALYLQNKGQKYCQVRLPDDAEWFAARIDGREVRAEQAGDELRIALPPSREFPLVSIEYASSNPPLGLVGGCRAVWPEVVLPVMSREWQVTAPTEYRLWDDPDDRAHLHWRERLFGPLGRRPGDRPFDPQRSDDWQALANSFRSSTEVSRSQAGVEPSFEPWRNESDAGADVHAAANEYRVALTGEPNASAWFVHRGAVETARWAIAAVVAGVGLSLARRRPELWVALGAAAAVAAVWLPSALAPLASGVWLGALVAFIGQVWQPGERLKSRGKSVRDDRTSSSVQPAAVASLLVLVMFSCTLTCGAADDEPIAPTSDETNATVESDIYRVFIPVDAEGKPNARFQVPTGLLQELRRYAGSSAEQPAGWLVTAARYQCTLARDGNPGRLDVSELLVEYHLHVFEGESQIRLPFDRTQATLAADSATLDGQPVELVWDDKSKSLLCHVDEPGDFPLQFRLLPKAVDAGESTGFALSVPRVPSARLEVIAPPEAMPVEISDALGATNQLADNRGLSVELGPVSQFAVRWNQRLSAEAPAVEVEELLWLKVQPGSVVLDARLNYQVTSGELRRVELAADHRLWRIPGEEDASPAFSERISPGDPLTLNSPQLVQLDLAAPADDRLSLNLSWLLTGSSGVGNLRLPMFQAVGARHVKRWLAVTVDSGLEYDIHNDERLEGLPPADFAAQWGGADAALLRDALAYRLPEGQTDWSLATRPREPQTTIKEKLALSFDRAGALVEYDAQLRTTAGFVFEHRLIVPPELRIDRLSLEEDGTERLAHWGRDDAGVVTLFLNRRVTGAQRLLLQGWLPSPPAGRMPLPVLTIEPGDPAVTSERAEILDRSVRIYRQPSALLSLTGLRGLSETAEPIADAANRRFGRLVAAFNASGDYGATLTIAPNDPRIDSATQLVSLKLLDQAWTAACDLWFTVEGGSLDALRFELPPNWHGPFEVTPAAAVEVYDQPGRKGKQLVVRPRSPWQGPTSLRIEAALKSSPGEPIAAPDIVPQLPEVERFVALPVQVGLEAVSWDTARLVAAPPPERLADAGMSSEKFHVYRAVGENPQALLAAARQANDVARVRLADISVASDDGVWRAVAAFDLEPGGQTTCPLQLSPDWQLLEVWIEGVPAAPPTTSETEWRLPLHSTRLPQRIEVMAVGPAGVPWPPQRPPVRLGDLPVQETLWTVAAPPGLELATHEAAELCDVERCELARADSLAALIDLPQEIVATTPADELTAWLRPWARRLLAARQARRGLGTPVKDPASDDDWLNTARRLGAESLFKSLAGSPGHGVSPRLAWSASRLESRRRPYHLRGAAPVASWRQKSLSGEWPRLGVTAVIAVGGLLALAAVRQSTVRDAWRRWPQLLIVVGGVVWWLYLEPSALGLAIMACGFWSAVRSLWRPG
ncbi:MAG TPA: hypothetical protein VF306_22395 [Pirellulales bacterium]